MFAESAIAPWASRGIFYRRQQKKFLGAKFQIDGTGTNDGAENKHRTDKRFRVLLYF